MARQQRKKSASRQLILGHMERVSRDVFSDYRKELTDLVGRAHGVYALYKGDHLYYVGLATNLRSRIKSHLRDRHARKWDKFSLYLIRKADHIRELESLIMRIASPKGNAAVGKLRRSKNLRATLKASVRQAQRQETDELFGSKPRQPKRRSEVRSSSSRKRTGRPVLASYFEKGATLRATYKGNTIRARVVYSGRIRFNGRLYDSPSDAARVAVGRVSCNGWKFWYYRNSQGEYARLSTLRKR